MATLHAELSNFRARELPGLEQNAPKSLETAEAQLGFNDNEPGEFYWHEDAPPVPLWRGALAVLRHMFGMKV
jgi:hypothetical protein